MKDQNSFLTTFKAQLEQTLYKSTSLMFSHNTTRHFSQQRNSNFHLHPHSSHIAKIKIDQNRKIRLQILDMWCKNVKEKCRDSKKNFCTMSFFVNPG